MPTWFPNTIGFVKHENSCGPEVNLKCTRVSLVFFVFLPWVETASCQKTCCWPDIVPCLNWSMTFRASTRKICPKWGPRKSHEKTTKKPRTDEGHEKATEKPWKRHGTIWAHCPRGTCYFSANHSPQNTTPCPTRACSLLPSQEAGFYWDGGSSCMSPAPSSMAVDRWMSAYAGHGQAVSTITGRAGLPPSEAGWLPDWVRPPPSQAGLGVFPGTARCRHPLAVWAVHPRGDSSLGALARAWV